MTEASTFALSLSNVSKSFEGLHAVDGVNLAVERSQADGTAVLSLARPPVNALDVELLESITAGFRGALAEEAPAIVVTGKGRCFSAGIDVKLTPTYTPEQRRAAIRAINGMVSVIYELERICAEDDDPPLRAGVGTHSQPRG